jgi:hypothetical protein
VATGVLLLGAAPGHAAEWLVGAGSVVDFGTATVDAGCASLTVAGDLLLASSLVDRVDDVLIAPGGALDAGAATLVVTGDWANAGTLAAGTASVEIADGCGQTVSTVSGDSAFYDLSVTSATGKNLVFESGSQTNVAGMLTLAGTSGNLLVIRSTVPGAEAFLHVDTPLADSASYVDVADNHAIGYPIRYGPDSAAGPNLVGWIFQAVAVPVLGVLGTLVLAGLLARVGGRVLAGRGVE